MPIMGGAWIQSFEIPKLAIGALLQPLYFCAACAAEYVNNNHGFGTEDCERCLCRRGRVAS